MATESNNSNSNSLPDLRPVPDVRAGEKRLHSSHRILQRGHLIEHMMTLGDGLWLAIGIYAIYAALAWWINRE